ncbi:hypothetical protein EZV62_003478 [Acer yangbiense]|uniref:DUF4283 domain-containing protein n=1 Tax=Acer yangbiense TaxID=1000413 RepID=A0A5C7IGZ7_9ROSI|nr:hypothetical protein EZV62_003478 [Acer yangbiense]
MDVVEVAKLYENLSIADEDGVVLEVSEEATVDGVKDVDRCLVGQVLTGKKVNREAFKGLIEQIWNPFGQVGVKLVTDNTFMFYFVSQEDRNQIWQRGPWHFGKSLIALERPEGSRNISKLGFNKADFSVQIHDIPILCMNQRVARWMAEQIGEVVEILLKLGKTEEVTMVSLKHERLPGFCYACGRIRHGIMECLDVEARKVVLDSSPTKFGAWLKAIILEKSNLRTNSQGIGSSLEKMKSVEGSREGNGEGSDSRRPDSQDSHKVDQASSAAATSGKTMGALIPLTIGGPSNVEEMCVDRPEVGPEISLSVLGCPNNNHNSRAQSEEVDVDMQNDKTSNSETQNTVEERITHVLPISQTQVNTPPFLFHHLKRKPQGNGKDLLEKGSYSRKQGKS